MSKARKRKTIPSKPIVDQASAHADAARRLWNQGRRSDAHDLFAEAIRQEPNNVRTYVMAARAFSEQFRFNRMEEVLDRLVRLAPNHPGIHHYRGEIYANLKLPLKAISCFERACDLPGSLPPSWMELASLYESSHRLDEAHELIERAVKARLELPIAWLVRGRIQRRRNELDLAESTFRDLIKRAPNSNWACQAWGEIALMKDRQGDYPGAVEAISECKQLQRQSEKQLLDLSDNAQSRIREMIDGITSEHFLHWRNDAADCPPLRMALLSGFPRSGTTLLEQLLDAHPELISSEERDFVGRELVTNVMTNQGSKTLLEIYSRISSAKLAAQRDRYFPVMEYLLGEQIGDRLLLDKNPAYNLTIPLMMRFFPETRLIVAIRDPRDVVLSCYLRYLPLNAVSVRFLTPERTAERYALDMAAWLTFREQMETPWCEVRYEDTVDNAADQTRRALECLGLHWSDDVLNYRQRLGREKVVTSPTYEAVSKPLNKGAIGRWKNYEELLAPAMKHLEPFIREFGYE